MSISLGDALLRAAATDPERDAVVLPGERWSYGRLAERAQGVARSLAALGVRAGRPRGRAHAELGGVPGRALRNRARGRHRRPDQRPLQGARDAPHPRRQRGQGRAHERPDGRARQPLRPAARGDQRRPDRAARGEGRARPDRRGGVRRAGPAHGAPGGRPARHRDAALHLRHDRPAARLPDLARRDRPRLGRRRRRDGHHRAPTPSGTRARCSTSPPSASRSPASWSAPPTSPPASSTPTRASSCSRPSGPSVWYPAYDRIMLGVVNHPRFGEIDLSGLKSVLAVGQPDTLRRLQATVPDAKLVSTFGMTESAGCAVISRVDDPEHVRMETAGGPVEGLEARLADDGEILLRGPLLFDGYHNEDESPFVDGWFGTGDLGAEVHGRIAFRGRKKEMLRVGGENVAPAQIEATPDGAPGGADGRGHRPPGRAPGRGPVRVRRAARRGHRGRADRALPRLAGLVQGPAARALRRAVADVGHEDPEVQAARADGERGRHDARPRRPLGRSHAGRRGVDLPGGSPTYAELADVRRGGRRGRPARRRRRLRRPRRRAAARGLGALPLARARRRPPGRDPGAAQRALQDPRARLRDAPRRAEAALHGRVVRGAGRRLRPAAGLRDRDRRARRRVLGGGRRRARRDACAPRTRA